MCPLVTSRTRTRRPRVVEPGDPVGVFDGDRRRRNRRLPRRVVHAAGVRRPQTDRTDRARPAPRPRRTAAAEPRAAGAIRHRLGVGRVRRRRTARSGPARARASRADRRSSTTSSTSASRPPGGVATVPPSPSIAIGWRGGSTISALSWPRIQRGTITRSVRTFSRPSAFIVSTAQAIARVRFSEPLRRLP